MCEIKERVEYESLDFPDLHREGKMLSLHSQRESAVKEELGAMWIDWRGGGVGGGPFTRRMGPREVTQKNKDRNEATPNT